jgi:hypothetical protein
MIKRIFAFLIIAAALGFGQATASEDNGQTHFYKDSVQAIQYAEFTQVDFDGYYQNLIQSEKDMVSRATTTSIISGITLGFGVFTTIVAFSDNGNIDKNSWAEVHRQTLQIAGVGLIVAGSIGLAFSLHDIICGTGENSKRASYERAYEIYKRRRAELKDGTKVIVTPTLDPLAAAAGLKMDVAF